MVGAHGVLNMWHLVLCLLLFQIYWGHGVYGLEAAAALYFGKHLSLLTLGECAMLAGIIPAPELLSPYREPSRSLLFFLDIGSAGRCAMRFCCRSAVES
jgi:hypothetical protein